MEADLNVEFPEIYDHPVPTNRLVWRIFISVAGIGRLNVMVTPLVRFFDDHPLMTLIDEYFRWDMPFREMVDQIEVNCAVTEDHCACRKLLRPLVR